MILKRIKNHENFNLKGSKVRPNNIGTLGLLCDDQGNFLCNTLELGLHQDGSKVTRDEILPETTVGLNGRIDAGVHALMITGSRKYYEHDDWIGIRPNSNLMVEVLSHSQAFAATMYNTQALRKKYVINTEIETSSGRQPITIDDSYIKEAIARQIIPHVGCLKVQHFGLTPFGVINSKITEETIDGDSFKYVPGEPLIGAFATYDSSVLRKGHSGQLIFKAPSGRFESAKLDVAPGSYTRKLAALREGLVTRAGTLVPESIDRHVNFDIRFHPGSEPWWSGGCILTGLAYINSRKPQDDVTFNMVNNGDVNEVMDHIYEGKYFFKRFGSAGPNWHTLRSNDYMRKTYYALNDGFFFNGCQKHNYLAVVDPDMPLRRAVLLMQAYHILETGQVSEGFSYSEDEEAILSELVASLRSQILAAEDSYRHIQYDTDAELRTYLSGKGRSIEGESEERVHEASEIYSYA